MAGQDSRVWSVIGIVGAVGLGVAMIPLRTLTVASNLAFVFLVFTIVVAELGGRAAGLVTAVVSALSLNFFLTQPYLTLTIQRSDDVIAFLALSVSGLVAAAFGRRRARSSTLLANARHGLEALEGTARRLSTGAPLDEVLEALRRTFRLDGVVVRHADGRLLAASPMAAAARAAPAIALDPRTLLGTDGQHRLGARGFRLPQGGGRLRLGDGLESLWCDLWEGDEAGLDVDEYRALTAAVTMLGLALVPGQCQAPGR